MREAAPGDEVDREAQKRHRRAAREPRRVAPADDRRRAARGLEVADAVVEPEPPAAIRAAKPAEDGRGLDGKLILPIAARSSAHAEHLFGRARTLQTLNHVVAATLGVGDLLVVLSGLEFAHLDLMQAGVDVAQAAGCPAALLGQWKRFVADEALTEGRGGARVASSA